MVASARLSPSELRSAARRRTPQPRRGPLGLVTKLPRSQLNWCRSQGVNAHGTLSTSLRGWGRSKSIGGLGAATLHAARKAVSRERTSSGESLTRCGSARRYGGARTGAGCSRRRWPVCGPAAALAQAVRVRSASSTGGGNVYISMPRVAAPSLPSYRRSIVAVAGRCSASRAAAEPAGLPVAGHVFDGRRPDAAAELPAAGRGRQGSAPGWPPDRNASRTGGESAGAGGLGHRAAPGGRSVTGCGLPSSDVATPIRAVMPVTGTGPVARRMSMSVASRPTT